MHLDARFDILIKYSCLRLVENLGGTWNELALQVYKDHLEIMTSGTFREQYGEKRGVDAYLSVFQSIDDDMKNKTFNCEPIPLSEKGIPSDGAHRIAASLKNNLELEYKTDTGSKSVDYSFSFFENHRFAYLGYVINQVLEIFQEARLAILWPSSDSSLDLESEIPNRLVKSEFFANQMQAINLVVNSYLDEPWLGSYASRYAGALDKVDACFVKNNKVKIILFDGKGVDTLELKERIRNIAQVGKHSIHITDTWQETFDKANIFFCSNFREWSGHTFLNCSKRFHQKLSLLENNLMNPENSIKDIVLVKGICMELFGLRESEDIDVVSCDQVKWKKENFLFESELVTTQDFYTDYFIYKNFLFWNFNKLKQNRLLKNDRKSISDQKLVYWSAANAGKYDFVILEFQKSRAKLRRAVLNFLSDIGLYNTIRSIYRRFK